MREARDANRSTTTPVEAGEGVLEEPVVALPTRGSGVTRTSGEVGPGDATPKGAGIRDSAGHDYTAPSPQRPTDRTRHPRVHELPRDIRPIEGRQDPVADERGARPTGADRELGSLRKAEFIAQDDVLPHPCDAILKPLLPPDREAVDGVVSHRERLVVNEKPHVLEPEGRTLLPKVGWGCEPRVHGEVPEGSLATFRDEVKGEDLHLPIRQVDVDRLIRDLDGNRGGRRRTDDRVHDRIVNDADGTRRRRDQIKRGRRDDGRSDQPRLHRRRRNRAVVDTDVASTGDEEAAGERGGNELLHDELRGFMRRHVRVSIAEE